MFSISTKDENGFEIKSLADSISGASIEIIPACGAILYSFKILHNGTFLNVVDSYASKIEFEEQVEAKGFKGAKLSPFVCRIQEGNYLYAAKDYKIDKFYLGKNAIHGLIYDQPFEVTQEEQNEEMAAVEMIHSYKGSDAGYPFLYDCKVRYELKKNCSLSITTTIINLDAGIIPVCDGWHPYFGFGSNIDDCQLEFQSKEIVEFDSELIPTGKLLPYQLFGSLQKIGDTFFDHCFTLNFAECQPMLLFRDPSLKLQVEIRPDKSYPYLQLYTPSHRKSLAIENLSAAPDAFNNGMGLISLPAGEEISFTTNYKVNSF
ncbi:MAG: aldose 1-epimerase [Gloeobacteraceae cyanobacterium ES-bin-316]|nr:aldose 1-epimerase [Ferruginibacter sp.]